MNGNEMGNSREYPPAPMTGVGMVVIKDGKILLIKRAFDPGAGKWSIPGGLVEVGEKLSEAGVREVEEETGLRTQVLELINVFDVIDRDGDGKVRYHYVLVGFLARPVGGQECVSKEVTEMRWVDYDTAKNMDLTKTAHKALSELFGATLT